MRSLARHRILVLTLSMMATAGCARRSSGPLLVFGAASLTDVLQAIAHEYTSMHGLPDDVIRFHFHGSDVCASQIRRGAPADLFISADDATVISLARDGLVSRNGYRRLVTNRLALIVPRHHPTTIRTVNDLGQPGWRRFALGNPETVPAGRYGAAALARLGLWHIVEPRLLRAEHVRQVMLYVARGEADAGIVYLTDAEIDSSVSVAEVLDPDLSPPVIYSAAIITGTRRIPAARAFLAFVAGEEAAAIWRRYGFSILAPSLREQGLPGD